MKLIPLSLGKFAQVSDYRFEFLNQWNWFAQKDKRTGILYAVRNIRINGKRTIARMHRVITNCPVNKVIDHKDRDGLNNQDENLRICSKTQNQANSRKREGNAIYKGIYLVKHKNKIYKYWRAQIGFNNKKMGLGYFKTQIEAAKAYDVKAKKLFGEFALVNF
jgi:hypothetical protein